ncbi:unnamed protein product [Parnassius apollo]|uniref:(apollo) hypothetical protein n=1 Tax=Parnassius apollo TaxID=110799 RepID=A0A8S3XUY3_PARAO|nr:unnamed protein product [Parnassius apollo]
MATIWAALVVVGNTLESYDDQPPPSFDDQVIYQEYSDLDTVPLAVDQKIGNAMKRGYNTLREPDENTAVLLYKIIQGSRLRDEFPGQYYRPISESVDYVELSPKTPETVDTKMMVTKRLTNVNKRREANNAYKSNSRYRPQQKWKAKKGSQMICYFKLCTFRSPS